MPSLALLFHLVHQQDSDVCIDCTGLAAGWCEYLEHHARKIYSGELNPGVASAHLLANKIKQGAVQDGDSVRDIYRKQWSGLTTAVDVMTAIQPLIQVSWVRVENVHTGGRDAEIVRLNPELGWDAHE